MLAPGFSYKTTTQSSDSTLAGVRISEQESTVVDSTTVNDQAVLRTVTKDTETMADGVHVTTTTDYSQRTGPAQLTLLHYETATTIAGKAWSTSRTEYLPPLVIVDSYGLALGQSLEQRWQSSTTVNYANPSWRSDSYQTDDTLIVKLAAIETITVPAGTYETCRFEYADKADPPWAAQVWVVRGLGVVVKTTVMAPAANNQTTTSLSVVTSLEVNGKKL
jgi:hypothetical protein